MNERAGKAWKAVSGLFRRVVRVAAVVVVVYAVIGFFSARLAPAPAEWVEVLAEGSDSPRAASGVGVRGLDTDAPEVRRWLEERGVELRGAVSVHSGRSHDAEGTFAEVAEAALGADLDFVILGDHPNDWLDVPGALDPVVVDSTVLIPGQEMVIESKGRALVVGLDADTLVRRWEGEVADLSARVAAVDGFISVVHPRSPRGRERWQVGVDAPGVHAWESIDMSEVARLRLADRWAPYHIVSFLIGLATGTSHRPVLHLNRERASAPGLLAYDSARIRQPLTLTAALNHHPKARIAGRLVPSYAAFFRTFTNHVLVPEAPGSEPMRAREVVLDGIRSSRVYVSLGRASEATGFDFRRFDPTLPTIGLRLPPDAPGAMAVRLLRDGEEVAWTRGLPGEVLAFDVPPGGLYRVEVYRAGIPLGPWRYGMSLWILSNPVDVER